ncbi:MAG TPA: flagellin [Caulobacteraceae bacterium]|nr:flagellin [Caulobacteraceae bacterium]
MSITVTGANPLSQSLLDPAGPGQTSGPAATQPTDAGQAPAAVAIGRNGGLDLSVVDSVAFSLNRATAIADVAIGAGQQVAGLLAQMKEQATAAGDPALDAASRAGLNTDFKAELAQIAQTVGQAEFDGVNLLKGEGHAGLKLPTGADGGPTLTLSAQDLSLGGPAITFGATASLGTASAAGAALADVSDSLSNVERALAALNDQAGQIAAHGAIINRLSDALSTQTAANASGDADGARLLALQVQQQLGAQGEPIANQSPQLVLSLFR